MMNMHKLGIVSQAAKRFEHTENPVNMRFPAIHYAKYGRIG